MKLQLLSVILFSSMWTSSVYAQTIELASKIDVEQKFETPSLTTEWFEDIDARTEYSSTAHSADGQVKIRYSSRPINYYNEDGKLVPIVSTLHRSMFNSWIGDQQPYPTYFMETGAFGISLGNGHHLNFGEQTIINNELTTFEYTFDGETAIGNVTNGIQKIIKFRENGAKYAYVLQSQNNVPSSFEEIIHLPDRYTIEQNTEYGNSTVNGWSGSLVVRNEKQEQVGSIGLPVCFDANGQSTVASYSIIQTENGYRIKITVPENWLNDPTRAYPVTIDPIVTGPTATWTGGLMDSCIDPTYNKDSILVTIPAGISVTELNVTSSYYADPWTGATKGQGKMKFSTSCNQSQIFTITGPNGTTAGTAYLDYYNLYNPLTCCFPKSCGASTFYLTMQLARTALGAGCNTTYIRYDPATTSWPFEAVVVGKTAESYGIQWSVPTSPKCANDCDIFGSIYAYFGVPPYTFTHPWSTDTIVQGNNTGCSTGATSAVLDLVIPNCPVYCDENYTSIDIPPATITDACGNTVSGLPTRTVPIKPVPQVSAIYDTLICSGEPFTIPVEPCIAGSDLTWIGNGAWGNAYITDTLFNSSGSYGVYEYEAWASLDGCDSDTSNYSIYIQPEATAQFSSEPEPVITANEVVITNTSEFPTGNGSVVIWDLGDGAASFEESPVHAYAEPGSYTVCLYIIDDAQCTDSVCNVITVVPAEVQIPNVVTPNNDGINDLLIFNYLDYYPENELYIFNRWGNVVHHAVNYTNDWNGIGFEEGTYYFTLQVKEIGETYSGFFQLVKD